jgi:hypothetical protein
MILTFSRLSALATSVLILLTGCEFVTAPPVPTSDSRTFNVFGIFNADSTRHSVYVVARKAGDSLQAVQSEVYDSEGKLISRSMEQTAGCISEYGSYGSIKARCELHVFKPEPGRSYELRVSATDRPEVRGEFQVPGEFEIREMETSRSPPGAFDLRMSWSPSAGAHRYLVSVRPAIQPLCGSTYGCEEKWSVDTTDTSIVTSVPVSVTTHGSGPWYVDVHAVERRLFEYLTTGHPGEIFTVLPVSSVTGGTGAIGSWMRRSRVIP